MAAYAAVVSVTNIMDQIQNHPRHSFSFDNKQMESLRKYVNFLVDFLEYCSNVGSKDGECLESQIATAAFAAEDVLESHVVDQIHAGSTLTGETSSCFLVDLQKVIEDMESTRKSIMEVIAQRGLIDQRTKFSRPATSSRPLTAGKNVMVDYDDELIQLMDVLTRQNHTRQIIPIVGMGGIGKTTLARNVYERSLIKQHFDVRLWATVSQEHSAEKILLQLLSCLEKSSSGTVHELGLMLHKTLTSRRYLVVLDDMWSIKAWEEIQLFLPHNSNGSRVVITTRLSTMANQLGSNSFEMKFLDENTSWKLLCEKAFGEEGVPKELEDVGKKIAKNCKGLPLSIVVTGGHLRKSSRMKEYWELVSNDINSILSSDDDDRCLKILYLSYNYLPVYLKPCFLYMGIYREDKEIIVSRLIELWVAEGFLKPNKVCTLEKVADSYFDDLIERNLILFYDDIGVCVIHDLLREMCLRVAEKEKFFCVLKNDTARVIRTERRVVIQDYLPSEEHCPKIFHALRSAQHVRSVTWKQGKLSFDLRLLRVLKSVGEWDGAVDYFQQVNLRYIKFNLSNIESSIVCLPSSISRLWNLQTLKIRGGTEGVIVPSEIWEMPQLRNVQILPKFGFPDPPLGDRLGQAEEVVLQNLRTLSKVENFRMSEEACKRIPNIVRLVLLYQNLLNECEASSYYFSHNLGRFHKLEAIGLTFLDDCARDFALSFIFPSSLSQLDLGGSLLYWEDLTMIGSLPCLVYLSLQTRSVTGVEWNPIDGEFPRLKHLYIEACDLIHWNADSSHFPVLEYLAFYRHDKLDEIPSGIGEIPTLRLIELFHCSVPLAVSAMEILVEQESLGNKELHLKVHFQKKAANNFREKLEQKGLRSKNLIQVIYTKILF